MHGTILYLTYFIYNEITREWLTQYKKVASNIIIISFPPLWNSLLIIKYSNNLSITNNSIKIIK